MVSHHELMSSTLITYIQHHRKLIFITLLFILLIFGANGLRAEDRRIVTLHVDGEELIVPTTASTVGELLERAEIELLEHDLVEPSLESAIVTDSFNINVYRARPVTVIDGAKRSGGDESIPKPKTYCGVGRANRL